MSAQLATQYWPELRNAKQPAPLPRVSGTFSFDSAREWQALVAQGVAGTFRLRDPAATRAGLYGPFSGQGECLEPVCTHGEAYWIDPAATPCDGDLVVVQMDSAKARRIDEHIRADPRLLAMHGTGPHDLVTKFLRKMGSQWMLLCNTGSSFLHDRGRNETHRVLGVVRYVERNGRPIYGCGVVAHQIDPNAATDTYSATDAGPITVTLAGAATDAVYQIKYVEITLAESCTVEVTASYRIAVNSPGGAGWTVTHGVARMNTAGTSVNFVQPFDKNGVNVYEPVASSGQFTQAAGTYRFGVGCRIQDVTASDVDAIFRDISIAVNVVKR